VPIPRELALVLARHKQSAGDAQPDIFVFATRSGRLSDSATSPVRSERRSSAPPTSTTSPRSRSSIRPTRPAAPSRLRRALCRRCTRFATRSRRGRFWPGRAWTKFAFLLGHRDATVTRAVYVREIADARRRHMRRSRMISEYAGALRIALEDGHSQSPRESDPIAPAPVIQSEGVSLSGFQIASIAGRRAAGKTASRTQTCQIAATSQSRRGDSNPGPLHYELPICRAFTLDTGV
jgi:hypothetical protein